jgi:hypothetical protein
MTLEDALEDREFMSLGRIRAELAAHGCRLLATLTEKPFGGEPEFIQVTNDLDPPEWIEPTPAAVLAWLGY